MVARGLLEEVGDLIGRGFGLDLKPLRSVGYRHMGLVYNQLMSLDDALALMKRDTRHLAKRQLTWFRNQVGTHWFHPESRNEIFETAKKFLAAGAESEGGVLLPRKPVY